MPASLYVNDAVSPILAVTGSAPASPEIKSKTVAQSAVAVTLTFFETFVSFSIVTCKFSGALNDTIRETSAVVVRLFNPVAVTLIVWLPSLKVCLTFPPDLIEDETGDPSP